MRCAACGFGNPRGSRFCNRCAEPMPDHACPACGVSNHPQNESCQSCGAAMVDRPSLLPSGAERRQITVVFSDLVGSTAMSRDLDAEDFRDLLNEYQAICRDVVAELDGYVAQYLGD